MPHKKLSENTLEERIHTSTDIPHIQSFCYYLAMGANPHIAPYDHGRDLFRQIEFRMNTEEDINNKHALKQMSKILLRHEISRTRSYLDPHKKLENLPRSPKIDKTPSCPTSVIPRRDSSYVEQYTNKNKINHLEK